MADNTGLFYGPAESRRTQTPVEFSSEEENAGRFIPPSDVQEFLSKIPIVRNLVNARGSIRVNPANTSDVDKVVKHESVHAMLNPLVESGMLPQLNSQNPSFSPIASALTAAGAGISSTEAPAYAATGETSQVGVNNPLSQAYVNYLKQQLFKLDPKLAAKYGSAAGR